MFSKNECAVQPNYFVTLMVFQWTVQIVKRKKA